eukprot:216135-Chlamydomonas_euryale.AAC.1
MAHGTRDMAHGTRGTVHDAWHTRHTPHTARRMAHTTSMQRPASLLLPPPSPNPRSPTRGVRVRGREEAPTHTFPYLLPACERARGSPNTHHSILAPGVAQRRGQLEQRRVCLRVRAVRSNVRV